jgi:PilZ domain
MGSPSKRRSDRVSLTLLLEVSGKDAQGQDFKDTAKTVLISRHGAVVVLERELAPGQQIHLRRQAPSEARREGAARVIGQFGKQRDGYLYGVEITDVDIDLWGIEFPPVVESNEAVARMLLECCYCHSREVMYLNGLELRAFETNRGIAHHCKTCGVPSIWTQAQQEDEKKLTGRGSRSKRNNSEAPAEPAPENEQRSRQRLRLKTRLTACVRQPGTDDELAVCEDISPIGMCFRSKRRYDADAPVDVAVPYSPDAANIFLPARIVYSEEMPKAGLFRHGTQYRKVGPHTS